MTCSLCQRTFDGRQQKFVVESLERATWGWIRRGIFCSKSCLTRWRSGLVPLQCAVCMYVIPGKLTKLKPRSLRGSAICSKSCSAILRLLTRPCSSEEWQRLNRAMQREVSEAIRDRDRNTCQVCGTRRSKGKIISADHIVPLRLAKEHDPINLITLCEAQCHRRKSEIESYLFEGDVAGFLTGLKKAGWPMRKVRMAMKRYRLPSALNQLRRPAREKSIFRVGYRPSPIC
jgi:5-methylcytosine-specific restriction endonuclease McrA